jgi:hypothetical protein
MSTYRKISRTDVNFCLDVALLCLFLAVCALSVILEFVFPVGTSADGWQLWGRNYAEWSRIRFALLATMAAAVLLHVMLHWSWVCGVVTSRLGTKKPATAHDDPSRTLWGVGLLIVVVNIVGGLVAAAALSIQPPLTPP